MHLEAEGKKRKREVADGNLASEILFMQLPLTGHKAAEVLQAGLSSQQAEGCDKHGPRACAAQTQTS